VRTTLEPFYWPAGSGNEPATPPPSDLRVLGHDERAWFVATGDGSVRLVDPASPLNTRFVNSSEKHFVGALAALAQRRTELEQARSSHDALLTISELRHDLNRINILALGDRSNFWVVVLDRLEDDLP
jgi:hypothetical protein